MTIKELAESRKKVHEKFYKTLKSCKIVKAWLDKNKVLCIKYNNGEYYHYNGTVQNLTWY